MHANLLFSVDLGAKPCEIKCVFSIKSHEGAGVPDLWPCRLQRSVFFCALWQVGSWESAVITVSDLCKREVRANTEAARRTEETSHTPPAMGPQRRGAPSDTRERSRRHLRCVWTIFGSSGTLSHASGATGNGLKRLLGADYAPFVKGLPRDLLVIAAVCFS